MLFLNAIQREQVKSMATEELNNGHSLDSQWRIMFYPDIHPLADEEIKTIERVDTGGHALKTLLTL